MSPRLPLEVIERIINHSGDHPKTLRNMSCTCRNLRPRSLCLMVSHPSFQSRNQIFDFCDFLQANAHLKSFVRSISVAANDLAPIPLLKILPNVSGITLISSEPITDSPESTSPPVPTVRLNRASLTCCREFGTRIHTLHLSKLSFTTVLEFARMLFAFVNLAHLTCTGTVINTEANPTLFEAMQRRLSQRLRLKGLTIDIHDSYTHPRTQSVGALLLCSGLVQSTLESLYIESHRFPGELLAQLNLPSDSEWPRLRSLVLKLFIQGGSYDARAVVQAAELLTDLRRTSPRLEEVAVDLHNSNIVMNGVPHSFGSDSYGDLERALLAFSHPKITWTINSLRAGRRLFWAQELGKCFPSLFQRGALSVLPPSRVSPSPEFKFLAGHEDGLLDLVASPDGKWMASASKDGTIIIWSTSDGEIAQQWVAHHYETVWCLAFSPDSRFLVSGGNDGEAVVWDISGGKHEVIGVFKEHTGSEAVRCCAWSPCGNVIASGSVDETVRLWDARTLHQIHIFGPLFASDTIRRVEFSPNGRWLLSMSDLTFDQPIWDVVSGILHRSLLQPEDEQLNDILWAFLTAPDPGGNPLAGMPALSLEAILSDDFEASAATVWDVATGKKLFGFGDVELDLGKRGDLGFSRDGRLILWQASLADNRAVKIWDTSIGVELCTLQGYDNSSVWRARFSPHGEYIAIASYDDHKARVWRTGDGSFIGTFSEHLSPVNSLVFSSDGETLTSAGDDGTIVIGRVCDIVPTDGGQDL